jgi:hypothetical protein
MATKPMFTPSHPLNTAVLFLIFNRPNTTKEVFETIRKAKPPRLYVAADGPRESRKGEVEKVQAVRSYVMSNIDWDCEVKTLFRGENIGCKIAVSSAITWFFENEEMGIILEDDCLPSQSFYWFCEELLERFRDEPRMLMISGRNELGSLKSNKYSYFYTLGSIWGWASWRRAWKYFDLDIKLWNDNDAKNNINDFAKLAPSKAEDVLNGCRSVLAGKVSTWDYQWTFSRMANRGLGVIPTVNLIKNIGFCSDGTHTTSANSPYASVVVGDVSFPLKHNPNLELDHKYYNETYKAMNSRFSRAKTLAKIWMLRIAKRQA